MTQNLEKLSMPHPRTGRAESNSSADKASKAWLDLGTYAREVLAAQDTRRFVLGFTICGSLMRK
jgi:hypothetical protein